MSAEKKPFITTRLGRYNLCNPSKESVCVNIFDPSIHVKPLWFNLRELGFADAADSVEWGELALTLCDAYIEQTWVASDLDAVKAFRKHLEDAQNRRRFDKVFWEKKIEQLKSRMTEVTKQLAHAEIAYADVLEQEREVA